MTFALRRRSTAHASAGRQIWEDLVLPLAILFPLCLALGGVPPTPEPGKPAPHFDHLARQLEFTDSSGTPSQHREIGEVVIGWFGPSDSAHLLGGDLWTAARLTVEQANRSGGWEGRAFRLAPCWTENPWSTGVARLFKLVYEEEVVALLGSIDGASTHLAEQVVAKARLPLVSPVSTDASVNLAGVPWMFSCAPSDAAVAESIGGAVARELDHGISPTRVALVNATDHDSRALTEELLQALTARRCLPAHRFEFTPGGDTFEAQLRALKSSEAGLLLLIADAEDSARFLHALRRAGGETPVIGGPSMEQRAFQRLAGDAARGVRFPCLIDSGDALPVREASQAPASVCFREAFLQATGHEPDTHALLARDATQLLLDAIRRAGPDRAAIRQALRDLSPWEGLAGPITFDGLGRNTRRQIELVTVRRGEPATR